MHHYKQKYSAEEYHAKETRLSIIGSFLAGGLAAAATNPFECITVNM